MLPNIYRTIVFPFIEIVRGENITRCLSELKKTQYLSYEHLKELQLNKLKKIIDYSYKNIAYYKELFDIIELKPSHIQNLDDFKKVPFLTKELIRANMNKLVNNGFKGKIEKCHSGGTQGEPLHLIRDAESSAYARAALFRALEWYGIKIGDKQLRVWGMPLDKKLAEKEKNKDLLLNRIRISAFDIRKNKMEEYFALIKSFRPKYIYGYVSAIVKICQLMSETGFNGKELKIKHVVTTAEYLDMYQRRIIEDFFCCKVINEYGCGEIGPIAHECPEGNLHIHMENVLVEFAEDEEYRGNNAEILLTNLNSFAMPLIRYKIGDTGKLRTAKCTCERHSEIMDFGTGRVVSILMAADGHFVAGNYFRYLAADFIEKHKGIKDFRVVQKEKKRLEITLSKDKNFSRDILKLFSTKIKEALGQEMRIDFFFQEEIPVEKSGKRLYVVSELKEKPEGN